jgi:tetratricopeptide (TPR) repeat protein
LSGDTAAALINFDKADSLGVINDDSKEILVQRIQIYVELDNLSEAENSAAQLVMLAPGEFRSYQMYFQVLMSVGKYDRAEELLAEAEKYTDAYSNIFDKEDMCFNRAMIFAVKAELDADNEAKHYRSALAVFDEFLTSPDLPEDVITDIAIAKAEIFLKLEKHSDALECVSSLSGKDSLDETDIDAGESDEDASGENDIKEKIDFIKLTCYLGLEDYENSRDYAERLKGSENEHYEYFAIYADAFIAQKLAAKDDSQKELAEIKYNNAIAYFKNKAFANPMDIFATIFRIRLYAENGKFEQAEDLIIIIPVEVQKDMNKYLSDCRAELK